MKTLIITLFTTIICLQSKSQTIKPYTIWQNGTEDYIYSIYLKNQLIQIADYSTPEEQDIILSRKYYGYYDDCGLSHIDSLKKEGIYYIEIWDSDLNDGGEVIEEPKCLEISITEDGKTAIFYDSDRQQFFENYKKEKIPKNMEEYLKQQVPEIYKMYRSRK